MKTVSVLAILLLMQTLIYAQTDDDAVKATLENYMSGKSDRMSKAFHPSAFMKYIDVKTGDYKDVPIAEFLERIKASEGKPAPGVKKRIVFYNITGKAAQAKIEIDTPSSMMYDYMNLLKIDGEWKIVSKIFNAELKSP